MGIGPVTWEDHARLWSTDPQYKAQYDVIKPTLDALGITDGDIKAPSTPSTSTTPSTTDTSGGNGGTYKVKPGDTLSSIASANGTTPEAILKVNPDITDPDKIQAGQTIKLPSDSGETPNTTDTTDTESTDTESTDEKDAASGSGKKYTVKAGDTLSSIAEANNTSPSAIMKANPKIKDADKIKVGDVLVIPDSNTKDKLPEDMDKSAQAKPLKDAETKKRADKWVKNLQEDLGITKEQAVGIVANLSHESWGLNPGIQQGGKIGDPNTQVQAGVNQTGFGICQWGESRRQALIDYAKAQGLPVTSEAAQYGFFLEELQYQYKDALDTVKATKTPQDAAQAFCTKFLIPSNPMMEDRLQWIDSNGEITVPKVRPHATGG